MDAYVDLFLSDKLVGDNGYLKNLGLIPLPADKLEAMRKRWDQRETLKMTDLKEG